MRQVTLIFGPGRSGTSLVAQILAQTGNFLGDNLVAANSHNRDGYFEDPDVVTLNQKLLQGFGITDSYTGMLPLPANWLSQEATKNTGEKIREILETKLTLHPPIAIKDPRISLLFPLWKQEIDSVNAISKSIFCIRHPVSAARSQHKVSRAPLSVCEALWLNRVAYAIHHLQDEGMIIDYDNLIEDPIPASRLILEYVADEKPQQQHLQRIGKNTPVKRDYRNQLSAENSLHSQAEELFLALKKNAVRKESRNDAISLAENIILASAMSIGKNESIRISRAQFKVSEKERVKRGQKIKSLDHTLYKTENLLRRTERRTEKIICRLEQKIKTLETQVMLTEKSRWMRFGNRLRSLLTILPTFKKE